MSWVEFETEPLKTASGTAYLARIPNPEDKPLKEVRVHPSMFDAQAGEDQLMRPSPETYSVLYDTAAEHIVLTFFSWPARGEVAL